MDFTDTLQTVSIIYAIFAITFLTIIYLYNKLK